MTGAPDAAAAALARALEREIRAGALAPGHRIGTKEELRTRHRVAVRTVSAAVRALELRGVVEARPGPGGGLFVAQPSASARVGQLVQGLREDGAGIADALAVRSALDGLLAAEAAQHATAADLEALRRILVRTATEAGDPRAVLRGSLALRRRIAEISPNRLLRGLYGELLGVAERASDEALRCAAATDPTAATRAPDAGAVSDAGAGFALQRELVDALAARDGARAAAQLTLLGSRRISQTCGPPAGISSSAVVAKPSRS